MEERSDTQLVAAVVSGDTTAFTALHERHRQRLQSYLRGRMELPAETAEDVVQDVFEALAANDYRALRHFAGKSAFYTYLCAIAIRRVYRLHRRQPQLADPPEEGFPEPAADDTPSNVTAADVRRAVGELPEEFRAPLMLYHFGGMEYREIADMLQVPMNTVATRICRAKKRLREALSG
jgi:RNA polymerase sigma-70 factor (ECF subfamily)